MNSEMGEPWVNPRGDRGCGRRLETHRPGKDHLDKSLATRHRHVRDNKQVRPLVTRQVTREPTSGSTFAGRGASSPHRVAVARRWPGHRRHRGTAGLTDRRQTPMRERMPPGRPRALAVGTRLAAAAQPENVTGTPINLTQERLVAHADVEPAKAALLSLLERARTTDQGH